MTTQTEQAQRELETGAWRDHQDGRELVSLVCLFDGPVLLGSMAILGGDYLTVEDAKADLLQCEGMTEAEASWVILEGDNA